MPVRDGASHETIDGIEGAGDMNIELIQTRAGEPIEIKNRRGEKRKVTINREWRVVADGEPIGYVCYRMLTRERRGNGMRYVSARWQSPGWVYSDDGLGPWIEVTSRKEAIERLEDNARFSRGV